MIQSHIIKDADEAAAIAREFAEKNRIDVGGPQDDAKSWFKGGAAFAASRETLTAKNLTSMLDHKFVLRKD